jgi:hypothetical protein
MRDRLKPGWNSCVAQPLAFAVRLISCRIWSLFIDEGNYT